MYIRFSQGITINSKKVINMTPYPNSKLKAKTNLIVLQKGHAQSITLSHAGKVFSILYTNVIDEQTEYIYRHIDYFRKY